LKGLTVVTAKTS